MRNVTMIRMKCSLLAILISLAFAMGASAQSAKIQVVRGTAVVQSKNMTQGTLVLRGRTFVVTKSTAIHNRHGQIITLDDIRSPDGSAVLISLDTADAVYYEATADRGVLLKVRVVEAMPQ
jgi:uncharacterized lipoprotein YajG